MNMQFPDPNRREQSKIRRDKAGELSTAIAHPQHLPNNDRNEPYIFNFTKGLMHGLNGLLTDPAHYQLFVDGTQSHDPAYFAKAPPYRGSVPKGGDMVVFLTEGTSQFEKLECPDSPYRQWESPTAGHAYVLEGPDPFAVTMPPAPEAGSAEFAAEMAEIYQMALCRDWQIASFMDVSLVQAVQTAGGGEVSNACIERLKRRNREVRGVAQRLSGMRWFQGVAATNDTMDQMHKKRRRFNQANTAKGVSASTIFRGEGEDGWHTPFLSQFMIMGSGGCKRNLTDRATGLIKYGAQTINQEVRVAVPNKDYMTQWADWIDIQNGLNKRALIADRKEEFLTGETRAMSTLRDMATYVHDDQLYQAYLNAALILLDEKYPFDPGIPYHDNSSNPLSRNNREPFALFGGPHLLTLVTEVSSRALKAVRLQKFSVHRRLRPEAAGALFHTIYSGYHPHRECPNTQPYPFTGDTLEAKARRQLGSTLATYTFPHDANDPGHDPALEQILTDIRIHNAGNNKEDPKKLDIAKWLLPMAFPEGSPMHPAYGAGHATVAGACVTLLKAFFNMRNPKEPGKPAYLVEEGGIALVPDGGVDAKDVTIDLLGVPIAKGLTLEGELNKLMWNISNARNIAGVHYYTDYIESALLGEAITIGILREQMLAYHPAEKVSMTVPLLVPRSLPECLLNGPDGTPGPIAKDDIVEAVEISSDGTLKPATATPGRS